MAQLELFDFSINYKSGRLNANADALSRQPQRPVPEETKESEEEYLLHTESVVAQQLVYLWRFIGILL